MRTARNDIRARTRVPQSREKLAGRLVTKHRVLVRRTFDHLDKCRIDLRSPQCGNGQRLMDLFVADLLEAARKGNAAGHEFERQDAEGVHVAAQGDRSLKHFRGHVRWGAGDTAAARPLPCK